MKEHLEDSLLECTMQDLLRYDDYNNDGHLSLHEFYTAFRECLVCPCFAFLHAFFSPFCLIYTIARIYTDQSKNIKTTDC